MVKYKLTKGVNQSYYQLLSKIISAHEDKFPFTFSREIVNLLIEQDYLKRYRTRTGFIRYKPLKTFTLPIKLKKIPIKWKEINYTYTFVATRGNAQYNKPGVKLPKPDRKIEVNCISYAPEKSLQDAKDKLSGAVEIVIKRNEYGFIYEQPNIGAGDSYKISDSKKQEKIMSKFRCFDHTFNRVKGEATFELPQDWWELSERELGELFWRNIRFELMQRGRQEKL